MIKSRSVAIVVALSAALAASAQAADTAAQSAAQSAAQPEELAEVVVTGTHLVTGFDQPTPVAMVEAQTLTEMSPNNMGEALAQLPALLSSVQNSTSGQGSGATANNGQNLLNLRELGPNRTLLLLDGQRMGVTNVNNSVDVNIIPQSLVKRVDIVTGGASASYGSDAVAGVVNFILDTGYKGLKVDLSGGETTYHDGKNGHLTVTYGTDLGEHGRLVAAAEYFQEQGQTYGQATGRNWFDYPTGAWTNPTTGALPTTVVVPNAKSQFGSYGGTITAVNGCPTGSAGAACTGLVDQQFLAGGALAPFVLGTNGNGFSGGGSGAIVNQPFMPDAIRDSVFVHGEFDASSSLTLWGEGSYNRSYTFLNSQVATQLTTTQFQIFEGNAYLPAAVNSIFAAAPGTQSFLLTRYDLDFGLQQDLGETTVKRFAVGAKGTLSDNWSYDATATYQDTLQRLDIRGTIERNLYAAADAVTNPATGAVVCRSQYYNAAGTFVPGGTGLDPGCAPLNLFGNGSVSPAAANYVMGWNDGDTTFIQTTYDANLHGKLPQAVSLGAGAVSVAAGLNYRREYANRAVDPLSAIYLDFTGIRGYPGAAGGSAATAPGLQGRYGGYQFYNPSPLNGRTTATEGYVELGIPLLKNLPLVKDLDATLAGRLTDYSQSGDQKMSKLGLNWALNDMVRVRATVSADTRAPSVLELFSTAQVTQGRNAAPCTVCVGAVRTSGQNITTGNPALDPERAHTATAGLVVTPLPGFQASADWYRIRVYDEIQAPSAQNVIDGCYTGNLAYCKFIQVNGNAITTTTGIKATDFVVVTTPELNAGTGSTEGVDFQAAYKLPHLPAGDLTLRMIGNYLISFVDAANGCPAGAAGTQLQNIVGSIGNNCGDHPRIAGSFSGNYDIGRFGVFVQERYINGGKIDPNFVVGTDIAVNSVPRIWYTDTTLKYDVGSFLGGKGSVYLTINNLFNRDPPFANASSRSWIVPTEFALYDVLGRRYELGFRFQM